MDTNNSRPALSVELGGLVLVIDDEEHVRLIAARMLQRRGFAVVVAHDGPAGVALYETSEAPIAAVLLDLSMPGMGGLEVAQALRRSNPRARIVLMTGYAEDDARRRFAELGIDAFLQKPFTLNDLGAAMKLALNGI